MFENLLVYQKAADFADLIARTTGTFPCGDCFLTNQPNRAARSVATNLRWPLHKPDRKNVSRLPANPLTSFSFCLCVPCHYLMVKR